jgi:predicted nucleotidyltransferase
MVIANPNKPNLLEILFSSRVRARLLALFMLNPGARFYAQILARSIGAQYSAVWKELVRLERAGVLQSDTSSHIKYYSLNPRLPILNELRRIVLKTVGIGDAMRHALTNSEKIEAVFMYGSFASGEIDASSDLDLMIVGEIKLQQIAPTIAHLEKELGRAVNYTIFTRAEWDDRLKANDPFVANVLASPKIMLLGDENALRSTAALGTHQALQRASSGNQKTPASRRPRAIRRRAQSRR